MEHKYTIAGAPEMKVPIRVRGISKDQHFFDEQTTTTRLIQNFIVIRLREQVDLDAELHVTNMRTQIGGTYRVAWINTHPEQGLHAAGLELLDPEGEIWERGTIPEGPRTAEATPDVVLECQRCYRRVAITVPEAESTSIGEGFTIARHCETCKSTTGWIYRGETPHAPEAPSRNETTLTNRASAPAAASTQKPAAYTKDNRQKGRAPIKMAIKITRRKYGLDIVDICETINVSRSGIYFATNQGYEVGEPVEVILPYHPDSVAIPVRARVVRQDATEGTLQKRVAIQLTSTRTQSR